MNESVADVLERAADLLWVRGRTRGVAEDTDGRLCLVGALLAARGDTPGWCGTARLPERAALDRYLARHPELLGERHTGPDADPYWHQRLAGGEFPAWVWNDCTHDDDLVIDTLRACAKEVRGCE